MIKIVVLGAFLAAFRRRCLRRPGQPRVRTLTEQELVDMMVGTSILCTRGGDTAGMIERVKAAVAQVSGSR